VGAVYRVCDRGHCMYRVVHTVMLQKAVKMNGPLICSATHSPVCCVQRICDVVDCKDLQISVR
jgi:hypothetical protein